METIKRIQIDYTDIEGALSGILKLSEKLKELKDDTARMGADSGEAFKKAETGIKKVNLSVTMLKNSINGAFSSLGKLVSRFGTLKNLVIGVLGASLLSARGTTKENTAGQTLGIGWAGSKAKQSIEDFMGVNLDFASAREALSSYDTKGPLAALGIEQDEASELYKKGADVAYFSLADKYEKKLRQYIDEAGGDRAMGVQNFKAVYGEGLEKTLGTSAGDFASLALSGELARYKSGYFEKKSEYGGINTKALIEGDKQIDSFLTKLKVLTATLAAELMPAINKVMTPLTEFLKNSIRWAKNSEGLKTTFKVISDAVGLIIEFIKGTFDAIAKSPFAEFLSKSLKNTAGALSESARVAKEKGGVEGVKTFTKEVWDRSQKVGVEMSQKNEKVIQEYKDDKTIRQTIRQSFGMFSKETLQASVKEGKELREYAKTLNLNINIKDSKGETIGTAQLKDVIGKGLQPTIEAKGL